MAVVTGLAAGALRVGAVISRVAAGTARGLAAGARIGARATASGTRSSGKLIQSASNVRSKILTSNKKIKKIKLNRKRINRSIFSEQKRKLREKKIESRSKSNNKKGLLSSPLDAFGGAKKFIYTLLFGLAITNIESIKKVFDKVAEGFANFGKMMIGIINATSFMTGLSIDKDGKKFNEEVEDVENAFNIPGFDNTIKNVKDETKKNKKNLPSGTRKDKLNEAAKTVTIDRSNIGGKYLSVEEEVVQSNTRLQIWGERNKPGHSLNLLPGGGYWKKIKFWEDLRNLKKQSEKEIRLKWEGGNPYLNKGSLNNERIDVLSNDGVNNENTVIINKTVIKKEYIPIPQ